MQRRLCQNGNGGSDLHDIEAFRRLLRTVDARDLTNDDRVALIDLLAACIAQPSHEPVARRLSSSSSSTSL